MAKKRKIRRASTRTRWAQRWAESGLTQREFAEKHGLTAGSLSRWIRELRDGEEVASGEFVERKSSPRLPGVMMTGMFGSPRRVRFRREGVQQPGWASGPCSASITFPHQRQLFLPIL